MQALFLIFLTCHTLSCLKPYKNMWSFTTNLTPDSLRESPSVLGTLLCLLMSSDFLVRLLSQTRTVDPLFNKVLSLQGSSTSTTT